MLMKIKLEHVHYMPKTLEEGVLYVSKEYKTASHLCACGCGIKVNTPLKPTEWSFQEKGSKPSLSPSVGNWQLACKSHYWIREGEIMWSNQWTSQQILLGRNSEEKRRELYYSSLNTKKLFNKFTDWLKGLFN